MHHPLSVGGQRADLMAALEELQKSVQDHAQRILQLSPPEDFGNITTVQRKDLILPYRCKTGNNRFTCPHQTEEPPHSQPFPKEDDVHSIMQFMACNGRNA